MRSITPKYLGDMSDQLRIYAEAVDELKHQIEPKQPVKLYTNLMKFDTDADGVNEDPLESRYAEWGMARGESITQAIFTSDGLKYDRRDTFEERMVQIGSDFDGPIVIDWEGAGLRSLNNGWPNRDHVIEEYVQLLLDARDWCPNALIGPYALPSREYWHQNATWHDRMRYCAPIFEASTALLPNCYDHLGTRSERDIERLSEIVRFALELANGTPVIPMIWDRWHNSSVEWGYKSIPEGEFGDLLSALCRVEYNGRRIAGLLCWGGDPYYWRACRMKRGEDFVYDNAKYDRMRDVYALEAPGAWASGDEAAFVAYLSQRYERTYRMMARAVKVATGGVA